MSPGSPLPLAHSLVQIAERATLELRWLYWTTNPRSQINHEVPRLLSTKQQGNHTHIMNLKNLGIVPPLKEGTM